MAEREPPGPARDEEEIRASVLEAVRQLAFEVSGPRAARAVAPTASLERDLGLGSLERVELTLRLETLFGGGLADAVLPLDTPEAIVRAIAASAANPEAACRSSPPSALGPARDPVVEPATLQAALWQRAELDPERPHVFLREEDGSERTLTYGGLLREAVKVGGGLREMGVAPGDRVALVLPTGLDFLRTFMGVLLAGAVPVPLYPPFRLARLEEYAERQAAILGNAGAAVLVTVARARSVASLLRRRVPSLSQVATADELAAQGPEILAPSGDGSAPALIQYTSGSTAHPKGVLLTHDNVLANIRAIAAAVELRPTDVVASWLPLFHDMGLIGSWLFSLNRGIPLALLPPTAFLARPDRWLWTIHERRATLSAAPNFAYELCARRIPEAAVEGLDLSSWRVALNGAEPVAQATVEGFAQRFRPFGFRAEAMLPVYGMAECSVALCFPPLSREPKFDRVERDRFEQHGDAVPVAAAASGLSFASCGQPLPGHDVGIVDEAGGAVPDRRVGRLLFRGPSTMQGYFGQPDATREIDRGDGWFDSGDLAYRADGEIYVAGRVKDLIIKGGRNLVPQEIEELAASVPGVRRGCVAAFGVASPSLGTERLVVVAETRVEDRQRRERLVAAVNERVAAGLGLPPDEVVMVGPGAVPKTSSGKLRRAATRQLYLEGGLGRPRRAAWRALARLAGESVIARARSAAGRILYGGQLALQAAGACLILAPLWATTALVRSRRVAFVGARLAARAVLGLAGWRLTVEGIESLPPRGPLVLAANHASYADILALIAALPIDFLFVAKREVLRYPVIGTLVRRAGHLTVERFDVARSVEDAARVSRALAAGACVLFFPEGTFTTAPGLRPFRLGAFKAAAEAGVPVFPVSLRGTRRLLRGDTWRPRRGPIHVRVGAPAQPEGVGWREIVALRDRVAGEIAAHCGEATLDLVAGGPTRP
jgi:fatty-acyl-CoA synthase